MSRFSTFVPLAGSLALVGCGQGPASVPPVIQTVAHVQKLHDGTYEVQLRYSVTSSGGPCLSKDWFKSWTNYSTNWIYLKTLDGTPTADQIVVTIEAGKKESPYAIKNLQGSVSFTNGTMRVQLEQPWYPDGVYMQGLQPYFLNGTYQTVTDSAPDKSQIPPTAVPGR